MPDLSKATARPWRKDYSAINNEVVIRAVCGPEFICIVVGPHKERDADLIVAAVNSCDEMREALKAHHRYMLQSRYAEGYKDSALHDTTVAALTKAEG